MNILVVLVEDGIGGTEEGVSENGVLDAWRAVLDIFRSGSRRFGSLTVCVTLSAQGTLVAAGIPDDVPEQNLYCLAAESEVDTARAAGDRTVDDIEAQRSIEFSRGESRAKSSKDIFRESGEGAAAVKLDWQIAG